MFQAIAKTVIKKVYDKRRLKLWAVAAEFVVFLLCGFILSWNLVETSGLLIFFHSVAEPRNSGKSAKSRKIHKNTKNTAKFGRNLIKYMSVQHIWTNFSYRGYLLSVKLQIYLGTLSPKRANNILKLPGVDYVVKNRALAMMLKALPLVHFWSV